MRPRFFASASEWREWLKANHATKDELLVGFYKRDSGRPSMSWSESVDEALCFGWIDGVRKSIDALRYSIRFSVRKNGSVWSKVNIAKVDALTAAGKMTEAGLAKFCERSTARSGIYAYEQGEVEFDPPTKAVFMADRKAWSFFEEQPPWYRKKAIWGVMKARRPKTREKRLADLIAASLRNERI